MRARSLPHSRAAVPTAPKGRGVVTRVGFFTALFCSALAALAVGSSGCASRGSQNPGAQSPERQSDAEYDVARDFFQKGQPRAALDHAAKAVSLNEENEKAHY